MTEILVVINSNNDNPVSIRTSVYKDGVKLNNVLGLTYNVQVDEGASLNLELYNKETTEKEYEQYNELLGDKIIQIYFRNWRQFLQELRDEDSILLCQ